MAEQDAPSLQVDAAAIALYADLTEDWNPLHLDPAFAAATEFGACIAHGTMSLALAWQALARRVGPEALAGAELEVRFTAPVRVGDRVTARLEPVAGETGRLAVAVVNQRGETVIAGSARLPGAG